MSRHIPCGRLRRLSCLGPREADVGPARAFEVAQRRVSVRSFEEGASSRPGPTSGASESLTRNMARHATGPTTSAEKTDIALRARRSRVQ